MKKEILAILILLLFFIILYFYLFLSKNNNDNKNICRGYLTDKEYLEHMIPHHQVAVDISIMLQKKSI